MVRFKYIVLRVQPFGTASLSHLQRSINQWNVNHLQTPAFRAVCLFISEVHFPIIFATTIHSKFDSEMLWFLALCSPYTTSSSHFLVSRILLLFHESTWKYRSLAFIRNRHIRGNYAQALTNNPTCNFYSLPFIGRVSRFKLISHFRRCLNFCKMAAERLLFGARNKAHASICQSF